MAPVIPQPPIQHTDLNIPRDWCFDIRPLFVLLLLVLLYDGFTCAELVTTRRTEAVTDVAYGTVDGSYTVVLNMQKQIVIGVEEKGNGGYADIPAALTPFLFRPIPINSADKNVLMTVKGVGPKLAEQIIALRRNQKTITTPQQLRRIPGVGAKKSALFAQQFDFSPANDDTTRR